MEGGNGGMLLAVRISMSLLTPSMFWPMLGHKKGRGPTSMYTAGLLTTPGP